MPHLARPAAHRVFQLNENALPNRELADFIYLAISFLTITQIISDCVAIDNPDGRMKNCDGRIA
ncbi:TPA: hypothetical protein ACYLN4_008222, partial [Burkholderia lata]